MTLKKRIYHVQNTAKEYESYAKVVFPIIAIIMIVSYIFFFNWPERWGIFLIIAWIVWLYMAMNIGANDIANNMWPAVWSKAITIIWAIFIAAIFEAAWAIIAGWDVVDTIKWWIVNPIVTWNEKEFIYMMLAALLWSALWINIATYTKSPVSATHSIIWWLVWAWIIAFWFNVVDWKNLWWIAISWILSPIMGWLVAALLLYSIRITILKSENMMKSARKWVPAYISLMTFSFTLYLIMKGLKQIVHIETSVAIIVGIIIWLITFIGTKFHIDRKYKKVVCNKAVINGMFWTPLVFAAALLSFAHGSNDVANAIGPLAAINDVIQNGFVNGKASIPLWVMLIWAFWLSLWLAIFGARLIKTVGNEITKLNITRAYCVALSAAITVIIASALWLPVSSTHIAIGWVFWVGLLREWIKRYNGKNKIYVQRNMVKSIVLSWIITLPISAWISWVLAFWLIKIF